MRLTVKDKDVDLWFVDDGFKQIAYNKLGQLEDIEEELGIDLITLMKALLLKGIFVKWNDKHIVHLDKNLLWLRTDVKPYVIDFKQSDQPHYLKDYGKTWALTKKELL